MAFDSLKPNTSQTLGDAVTSARENQNDMDTRLTAHIANESDAHNMDELIASKSSFEAHAADTESAHGIGYVSGRVTALESETATARGTASTLGTRLNVGLEQSGAVKLSGLASKWLDNGDTPTFIGATSFTVPGDRTKVYLAGVVCRFTVEEGYVYGAVATASFAASSTTVTLSTSYPVLDSSLAKVEISLLAFDDTIAATVAAMDADLTALTARVAALEA